ncbi:UDP-N-acetylglucosamine 1-carboxyvinyltransferase [Candidatus Azambacteria bacterium]|nr:UDP-N-acetylglucosamine 1-carboxyvinyltransferase [Candidatus Azambacteria bacterium]
MSEKFIIEGGHKLKGEIEVLGAKNAALPILVASVLSKERSIIDNIPLIGDVFTMLEILKSIGVKIKFLGKRKIQIDPSKIHLSNMDYDLVTSIRSSVFLFGALSSRFKNFKLTTPGGCQLGSRVLDPHFEGLKSVGVSIKKENGVYYVSNTAGKKGKREIVLSEMSVTATENVILASVLSKGTIDVYAAASEHYVQDLCHFLNKMGAKISGIGTSHLTIDGVESLSGSEHFVMYDPIEMGTFISLAASTQSDILIKNTIPEFIRFELLKFKEANVNFKILNKKKFSKGWGYELADLKIKPSKLKAVKKVHNMPYPSFSADILPIFAVLMTQAKGVSLIHDWMYEGRMKYIEELNRMGADAFICDPHRALVTGPTKLEGKNITGFDLRAGATLMIAALIASGKSVISNAYQVDRGYEEIEKRLKKIGAKIKRIKS